MSLNTNHQDPQITDLNTLHLAYVNICHLYYVIKYESSKHRHKHSIINTFVLSQNM